jgi:hypothetical protein
VWHNGRRQKNRNEILKILANVGSNMTKTVYVLQPSARKSAVDAIGMQIAKGHVDRPEARRLRQLDTLLLAARAECNGLGANFYVIGEDDTRGAPRTYQIYWRVGHGCFGARTSTGSNRSTTAYAPLHPQEPKR